MSAEWRATAAVDPWVGRRLVDRYRIDELIGRGGMSSVYRALDAALGRTVAVKLFRPELAGADDIRRQRDEVRLLASLNHPTLVTLFDAASTHDGQAFLVLEYVDGDDLRVTMDRGVMNAAHVGAIGADIADAIAWVHHRGIVHRDIKPANVLVPRRHDGPAIPHAKLADFGIARLVDSTRVTTKGSVIGTASYLSPEQATGTSVGASTDVYSLGLVLLECLTGQRTFEGSGIESVVARLSRDPEIPSGLGREWVRLLALMTRRSPEERPSASDVAVWLRTIASGTGIGPDRTMPQPSADETVPLPAADQTVPLPAAERGTPLAASDGATMTEPERTAVYPVSREGPTERFQRAPEPAGRTQPRKSVRRRVAIIAGAIAAVIVAALVISVAIQQSGPVESDIDYPVVDGDLGTHLEQLQRSVGT